MVTVLKYMTGAVIKKYWKLLLSLAITASLGFALISGLSSGYASLEHSLNQYLADYRYPNAMITTEVTNVSDASKLLSLKGVEACDTRLCANSMLKSESGDYYSVRVFSYREEEQQGFYFWDRIDPKGQDSVLLEYHFADSHNIKPGDRVSFRIREEYRSFLVEGIVSRPETLYAKISDRAWGINYDFGFVYASIDLLSKEYKKDSEKVREKLKEKENALEDGLDSAKNTLLEKEGELANAKDLLQNQKNLFSQKAEEAKAAQTQLFELRDNLLTSIRTLGQKRTDLDVLYRSTIDKKGTLSGQKKQLIQAKNGLAQIDGISAELSKTLGTIQWIESTGVIPYLSTFPQNVSLSDVLHFIEEKITGKPVEIPEGILLPETEAELRALYNTINHAVETVFPGKTLMTLTIGDVLFRYQQISGTVAEADRKLKEKRVQIVSKLAENGIAEGGIDAALQALDNGIAACDSGLTQILNGAAQLDAGIERLKAGVEEINATLLEIENQLAQATQELEKAEGEIRSAEAELNQRAEDAMKEFADMEEELDKAYQKLDENEGYDHLCNQFLLYLDPDADAEAVLEQAKQVLSAELSVTNSYTRESSPVQNRIDKNLNPLYALTVYCPIVFYLVTLGIIFLFMSMIIKQSRREIGILRALGFTKNRIRAVFCRISILVALAGLVIGAALAFGILRYVGAYFRDFFPLPFFNYGISPWMCTMGAAATVGICLLATLITTGTISRIMPKEAMSRPNPSKVHIPSWIRKLTGNMKPINTFSLTSLLRSKGRFLFASVCAAVSIMLIFASVSFIAAKNNVIDQTFTQRIHYDCQIFFEDAPDEELMNELERLGLVSKIQPLLYYDIEFSGENGTNPAVVNAVEPGTELVSIYDTDGEMRSVREGEILIERHLAKELDVKEGDQVRVNGAMMRVGGILDQCANYTHYVTLSDADRIGTPDLYCLIGKIPEEKYSELLAFLTENDFDGYLYTIFTPPFFRYNIELYNTYDAAAWLLSLFAVAIGFVIILNTMMTNLQEMKRELCVLRSLGFQRGEISRSRFTQTILQFLIAAPIGLAGGFFFARAVLLKIGSEGEEYAFSSGVKEYAIAVLIVFGYLVISHFLTMRRMGKWNISENVKDKE